MEYEISRKVINRPGIRWKAIGLQLVFAGLVPGGKSGGNLNSFTCRAMMR
jgi:hypothetical protein